MTAGWWVQPSARAGWRQDDASSSDFSHSGHRRCRMMPRSSWPVKSAAAFFPHSTQNPHQDKPTTWRSTSQWQAIKIIPNQWKATKKNKNKITLESRKLVFSFQGSRDDGRMMRADGWWEGVLAEQDDEGMMAGWCGPMARRWLMTGQAGWEGWWQDDGRMMRVEGRMMRACGYMSRMTPGWCIIEAGNTQLRKASYKSFHKLAHNGGQEAAHQDDTRMIGRMMTRMINKNNALRKKKLSPENRHHPVHPGWLTQKQDDIILILAIILPWGIGLLRGLRPPDPPVSRPGGLQTD